MKVYVIYEEEYNKIIKITGSEIEALKYCYHNTNVYYTEYELEKEVG